MSKSSNPHVKATIACAAPGCGSIRQLTNHWFLMVPIGSACLRGYAIVVWNDEALDIDGVMPLCGESCASKMLSIWMSDVKRSQENR